MAVIKRADIDVRKGLIDPVEDYAVMSLKFWRDVGHTDAEILRSFTAPNPDADAAWEAAQVDRVGHVYAPPADVRAHIRRLLAA